MADITIIGSGASAVHFALSVLRKGHKVTMLDVGYAGPGAVKPQDTFNRLKCSLEDPARYFLGEDFESVVPPDNAKEIYGFPPHKKYIFQHPPGFKHSADGFEPLFSFARGGLAQAWTGGSYPYDQDDLEAFPFGYEAMEPHYEEVAKRIGLMGARDDLARYFPYHKNILPPLEFDEHSRLLVDNYKAKGAKLTEKTGVVFGRSRVAVLSREQDGRSACDYSGRCIWGCPTDSLYVPALTLAQCAGFENFTYIPNRLVTHFKTDSSNRVSAVVTRCLEESPGNSGKSGNSNPVEEYAVDTLVLAAGTLSSSMIYLESLYRKTGEVIQLDGLMDNRQVLVPFIQLQMVGKPYKPESYQYHQLAVGFRMDDGDYVHGQITTLKTALMQPVLQGMPLDWKMATFLGRNLHSALGVINLNYSDTRRKGNTVTLQPGKNEDDLSTLKIHYKVPDGETAKMAISMKKTKKFLGGLGAIVPPGQAHTRPMGASVHYSGTLPMSEEVKPHTLSPDCRSHDFENLYIIDGTSLPCLPAKNLTFTLMANAARVAEKVF